MRLCARFDFLLVLACLLVAAGCGGGGTAATVTYTCSPRCPPGSHCEESGCVADSPPLDLSTSGADLTAGTCLPACSGTTPYCNAGQCVPCLQDSQCPVGQLCRTTASGNVCVQGCKSDSRCSGADSDGGVNASLKCCGGQCVDTSADVANCGACGTACSSPNASSSCVASTCTPGACSPGWAHCSKNPADGCETNVAIDTANCGACGVKCNLPNARAGCASGCYIAACLFGFDSCDNNDANGCETSVVSDVKNCGACAYNCPPIPNAKTVCQNAACALASCNVNFLDCNNDPRDGCEVNGNIDVKNCGSCGNSCPMGLICKNGGCTCPQCNFPNATSKCVNQVCVLDQCVKGWADCNKDPKDGCEVNTDIDQKNCGACGNVCPQNLPGCDQGMCVALWLPMGIQKDVDVNKLAGWKECFRNQYGNAGASLNDIQMNKCTGSRIGVACSPKDAQTLTLFAWSDRADAFFNTGDFNNNTHSANGIAWYYSTGYSWGYAPDGDIVSRNSCDTQDSALGGGKDGDQRLCWHTGGGSIQGGWRCGKNDSLNANNNWDRIIYHTP